MIIGNVAALRHDILTICHSSTVRGHSGVILTLHRLQEIFYWKKYRQDVRNFVKTCSTCKHAKYERVANLGILQPLIQFSVTSLWIL